MNSPNLIRVFINEAGSQSVFSRLVVHLETGGKL